MGTRADFYIGRGEQAEWLGSIAWDGHPDGIAESVLQAKDEQIYRAAVQCFLEGRDDRSLPADGWPWPWEDSHTTDYAYTFAGGSVWGCNAGKWWDATQEEPALDDEAVNEWDALDDAVFPNMADRKRRPLFGPHSGVIVLGV